MSPSRYPDWNERYNSEDYLFGTEPNEFLVSARSHLSGSHVLCLADGEGRNGVYLAGQGYEVTSIDSSSVALEKAGNLARSRHVNLNLQAADLTRYNLGSEAWDGIVSIFFHLPKKERTQIHQKVVRALTPGGCFIFEAYTPKQLEYGTGGPPDVDRLVTLDDLREELGELNWIHALETERDVVEGYGHNGRASVVQLIATAP